jgi:monoamine oxidase
LESLGKIPNLAPDTRALFRAYVEGFHAADANVMSARGLVATAETDDDELNSAAMFRWVRGYDTLVNKLVMDLPQEKLRLHMHVRKISWNTKGVAVLARDRVRGTPFEISARKVVVTLPLGVLQRPAHSGGIRWDPFPRRWEATMSSMSMGHVQTMVFCFRERFWEDISSAALSFLHTGPEFYFPTWWTQSPMRSNQLIAWQGGPKALEMASWSPAQRARAALQTLSKMTGKSLARITRLLSLYQTHNWSTDPWARGAFIYVLRGGSHDAPNLARAFGPSLFFAGEAAAPGSSRGTVHGAYESGLRAAQHVIRRL